MDRRTFLTAALAAPMLAPRKAEAQAPTRAETLLLVQEYGPNSMDMQGTGSSQPVNGVALNCYDRLVRFKTVPLPDGKGKTFTLNQLEPELAESWQEASDGMSVTFKLRDAKFHSGRAVSAKDVKWSLDRAVSIGGFATTQMNAGSMEKPEQFVALDDKTFRIDFLRRDKLLMPNLGVTIPFVFASKQGDGPGHRRRPLRPRRRLRRRREGLRHPGRAGRPLRPGRPAAARRRHAEIHRRLPVLALPRTRLPRLHQRLR